MHQITDYGIITYGNPDGNMDSRAVITLDSNGNHVGFINFHDPGMAFPSDSESGGKIYMHQPTSMLGITIDILRNESPVYLWMSVGSNIALLGTSREPVGEGE